MSINHLFTKTILFVFCCFTSLLPLHAQLEVNSYYIAETGASESVFAKSNNRFYTSNNYSTIQVYDINSTEMIEMFDVPVKEVKTMDIDPTGSFLLVGGSEGGLSIIDLKTKKEKLKLKGGIDYFYTARYTQDGKKVVAANLDTNVFVFNASTGVLEKKFKGPDMIWIWAMTFDKSLNYFVAGGSNGTTAMYDSKGSLYKKINGFTATVFTADASPDNKEFVLGAWDNTIKVYEFGCGYMRLDIRNGEKPVYSVKWSPDGKYILSGDESGVLRVWNATDGNFLSAYQAHTDRIDDIRFSPDKKYVLTSSTDGYVKLFKYDTLLAPTVDIFTYEYEEEYYNENYYEEPYVEANPVTDGVSLIPIYSAYCSSGVYDLDFNADGSKFVTAEYDFVSSVFNTTDAQLITSSYNQQFSTVTCVAFNSKTNQVAYAGIDTYITIYDAKDGQLVTTLYGHTASVFGLEWTNDGKLVSAATDNTLIIWDVKTGKAIKTLTGHTEYVWDLDIDSKNKTILSCAGSGQLYLWDLKTGKFKKAIQGLTGYLFDCTFSSDGKLIVAGSWDGTVTLLDAKGNTKWVNSTTTNTYVYAVAISPDNRLVFAGDNYGNVFIYDASNGVLKKTIYVSSQTINAIRFTKDKKHVVIGDDTGAIGFYDYNDFTNANR